MKIINFLLLNGLNFALNNNLSSNELIIGYNFYEVLKSYVLEKTFFAKYSII